MTWNTLANLATDQLVTEAHMDDIRENIEHLGAMKAGGTALSGLLSGKEISHIRDGVSVFNSANQTVPGSGSLGPNFDSELFDDGSYHDTSTNPNRLSLDVGSWLIGFMGTLTASAAIGTAADLAVALWRSGVKSRQLYQRVDTMASGGYMGISAVWVVPVLASEYVTLTLANNTTVNLTLQSGFLGASFWALRIDDDA